VELAAGALQYRQKMDETAKAWGKLSEAERARVRALIQPQVQGRLLQKVWQDGCV
jgi:hypothetical protein